MSLSVKQWRLAKEITQKDIAEALGVSIPTYAAMENKPEEITYKNGKKIAEVLGLNVEEINFFAE